ncbi:MAG: hypothetical protein AAGH65_02230 [Pseudomonadota bacterium]
MNAGTVLFLLIVVAYLGFEVWAVSKVGYRMEPVYIFERFVAVDRAMTRCGQPDAAMKTDFDRNRASVRQRAERELAEQGGDTNPAMIHQTLTDALRAQEAEVDALIDAVGCDDIELFKLMKGYENRARLNLPSTN